jgi:hypothetical protein
MKAKGHGERFFSAVPRFVVGAWVVVLLLLAYHWMAGTRQENRANQERVANEERVKQSITEFGARYDAVELARNLSDSDWSSPKYSWQLQSILVPKDSRPVLFVGGVHDIALDGADGPVCIFDILAGVWGTIRFSLACNRQQADTITAARPLPRRFAVITKIASVVKPDNPERDDDADHSPGPVFLAKGSLLDSMFVGDYYGDFDEIFSSRGAKP